MTWGAVASVGASLVGSALSSKASSKAAKAQQDSAASAQQLQYQQYQQQREDQEPFRQTGIAANDRLSMLLGLGGGSSNPRYSTGDFIDASGDSFQANSDLYEKSPEYRAAYDRFVQSHQARSGTQAALSKGSDEGNAEAEIGGYLGNDWLKNYNDSQQSTAESDPLYGSLTRKFSQADIDADPVYQSGLQFGLDEGTKGINARALQGGGYDSGATLKALTRYGNDYGSTKANESFNRYQTEGTNLYNRLAGLSGAGQTATNQVGAAAQNYGNSASNLITDAGNARSAGIVGQANAWSGALSDMSGAYNQYQTNKQNQSNFDRYFGSRTS